MLLSADTFAASKKVSLNFIYFLYGACTILFGAGGIKTGFCNYKMTKKEKKISEKLL